MPKKILSNCAHCGGSLLDENGKDGFQYRSQIGPGLMHQISCKCGIMTKLCQTLEDLQVVWNSKPNKKIKKEKIKITHPPIRGMEHANELDKGIDIGSSVGPSVENKSPF